MLGKLKELKFKFFVHQRIRVGTLYICSTPNTIKSFVTFSEVILLYGEKRELLKEYSFVVFLGLRDIPLCELIVCLLFE